jgi:Fanconi-associated nuclease 1
MKQLLIRCVRFQTEETASARIKYAGKHGPVSVEQAALEHYNALGANGFWSENQYWWQLMSLLFWQIIFARIPGVYSPLLGEFPSRFQDMPNDFFKKGFYSKRSDIIERRYRELSNCVSIPKVISAAYSEHKGEACRPIEDWNKFTLNHLCSGADGLTRDQLLLIMDRLLTDFNKHRSGLPDLFFFQPSPFFAEIKSESDSVKENQLDWLQFLSGKAGLSVEILLVNHKYQKTESIRKDLESTGFDVRIAGIEASASP